MHLTVADVLADRAGTGRGDMSTAMIKQLF